ncbi:hypothetical protein ASD56_00960 [Microbacterium sp. Root166]|uniref:hypothetical protein n=1 Tax=Microbacterium sp. Root166 TaxID=1736478 RepID=UPI0006FC7607|nr:hypothetical protein [Microbacterium sp. Root166]KQZ84981.1 hypothetical protein ASD56_00960 [Microbacterium sp. Root166]
MTVPAPHTAPAPQGAPASSLLRVAVWVAIGALIAAAVVCVVWVLVGDQQDIVGRAFFTILLLAGFAGAAILDAHLAPRRPAWFALASMGVWVAILLIGAVMIWMPDRTWWSGSSRLIQFLLIVLVLQLTLLYLRLYVRALQRNDTTFTRALAIVTIILVVCLAVLLVIPLMLGEYLDLPDIYWRVVVAVAILAAVGTALIPLINTLLAPRGPRSVAAGYGTAPIPPQHLAAEPAAPAQELLPWPTYVDARTPLPMLPDGSPDWNAYYTGYPSPGAHVFTAPEHEAAGHEPAAGTQTSPPPAPAAPGYEGFPPPPPLPPRP